DTYHAAHGNTVWATASGDKKTIARLRGSEYIDHTFRDSFPGWKTGGRAQIREWPRLSAYDRNGELLPSDEVPIEVEEASYEADLLELVTPGTLSPVYDPSAQVREESPGGGIMVEYTAPHGPKSVNKTITIIGGILSPVLTGSGTSSVSSPVVLV
ncbi:MAG: DnaT-like ssDNA-binding protein, partial [Gammaproteobacteria bacterium]